MRYTTIMQNISSVALVCKQTIQTELPPLVDEVSANFLQIEGAAWSAQRIPTAINLGFLDQSVTDSVQIIVTDIKGNCTGLIFDSKITTDLRVNLPILAK
jgi:hypothetical protein